MLGKAEYLKYVLKSVCEERIRFFLSEKAISEPKSLEVLKNSSSIIAFLNGNNWYSEFISRIPTEYEPLYRFAAFVSDNINKDKFIIKKIDGTALAHATNFIEKGKLDKFQKAHGEWHLQSIFIDQTQNLKDSL